LSMCPSDFAALIAKAMAVCSSRSRRNLNRRRYTASTRIANTNATMPASINSDDTKNLHKVNPKVNPSDWTHANKIATGKARNIHFRTTDDWRRLIDLDNSSVDN